MSPLLLALVFYTTGEAVYLDEGAEAGWRPGDIVEIEGARFALSDVTDQHARAEPTARSLRPQLGATVRRVSRGSLTPEAEVKVKVEPKKARPPKIDRAEAEALWAGAPDGWAEVQEAKRRDADEGATEAGRLWAELGVLGEAIGGAASRARLTLSTRAHGEYGRWRGALDLRALYMDAPPTLGARETYRLEARRLSVGYQREAWGASFGRLGASGRLGDDALDGARLSYGPATLSAGLAPSGVELLPESEAPQATLTLEETWRAGGVTAMAQLDGLINGYQGQLNRLAFAPALQIYTPRLTASASAEVDRADGQDPLVLTGSDAYLEGRALSWLRLGARLHTRRGLDTLRRRAEGLPLMEGSRRLVALDMRLDGGAWGLWSASAGLTQDEALGDGYAPSLGLWLPILEPLSLRGGLSLTDTPETRMNQGHAALTWRPLSGLPLELDAGGRASEVNIKGRPDLDQIEVTLTGGLFAQVYDARIHLYGERVMTHVDLYTLLLHLSWTFDDAY